MKTKFTVSLLAALVAASCAATDTPSSAQAASNTPTQVLQLDVAQSNQATAGALTIEQIMADQDWVARSPNSAFWMVDGSGVLYQQKRAGSVVSDWFHLPLDKDDAHKIPLEKLHNYAYNDGIYNVTLTYQIVPNDSGILSWFKKQEELFKLTLNFESDTARFVENIRIKTRDLKPGRYTLQMVASDPQRQQKVKREFEFEVMEENTDREIGTL